MKTQAIDWQISKLTRRGASDWSIPDVGHGLRAILYLLSGAVPFALISILAVWLAGSGGVAYVSAASWAIGFIFLALALDDEHGRGPLFAGTGLSLAALAWLGTRVSPEFGILVGFVLAAWAAAPVMKYVGVRTGGPGNTPPG